MTDQDAEDRSGPANPAGRRPEIVLSLATCLAVLGALIFVWSCLYRQPQVDEIAHLRSGWWISLGKKPFVDFFEHHNPGYAYLVAPLFRLFSRECHVFWAARAANAVCGLALAGCAAAIATRAGGGTVARRLSVYFLLMTPCIAVGLVDTRPDGVHAVVGTLALLAAATPSCSGGLAFLSGLGIGAAFCLSQKGLYYYLALLPVLVFWLRERKYRELAWLHAGASIPAVGMLGAFSAFGMFHNWWLLCFELNFKALRQSDGVLTILRHSFYPADCFFLAAGIAGLLLLLGRRSAPATLTLPPVIMAGAILWTGVPTSSYHFLPLFPYLAAFAGLALEAGLGPVRDRRPAALLLLIVFAGAGLYLPIRHVSWDLLDPEYDWNLERVSFVLANTPPGDNVFDPQMQFNIARPDPPWDHARELFSKTLREMGFPAHRDLESLLRDARPRFVGTHDLSKPEQALVDRFYVPCGYPNLRVLGAAVALESGATKSVELLSDGTYVLEAPHAVEVDGKPVKPGDSISLGSGNRQLRNPGPESKIILRLQTVPAPYRNRWNF